MFNRLKNLISPPEQSAPGIGSDNPHQNLQARPDPAKESVTHKEQGDAYLRNGDPEKAKACYQHAIALDPGYAKAHSNLGFIFKEQDNYGDAERCLQTALSIDPKIADSHYMLGAIFQARDRLENTVHHFRKALELDPDHEFAYRDLCYLLFQHGKIDEAMEVIISGITHNPGIADYHYYLGNLYTHSKEYDKAIASYRNALSLQPAHSGAYFNLGIALQEQGKLDDAIANFRKTIALDPGFADAHYRLGIIFYIDQHLLPEAEACFRRVLEIDPNHTETHYNLGNILRELKRLSEAEASCRRAIQLQPDHSDAHLNLGNVLLDLGRPSEAENSYRKVLQFTPDSAEILSNLGNVLKDMGRFVEAEASYRRALQINPELAEVHSNLGSTLKDIGRIAEAETSCRRALQINSNFAEAHINLGVILKELGQLAEAEASFRQALVIKPDLADVHSSVIFTMDLMVDKDTASLQEERKRWDAAHAAHLYQQQAHTNIPDPARRLRVGYISADLREHSAPKVFGGVLTQYDRSQFDVFAYSNSKEKNDRFTDLFRQNVTVWRDILGLTNDAVAQVIRDDQIDILVDLSGHTGGNRLLVFARKPAPIQITAWGYATGTGMRAMDVFFADPVLVPPEEKQHFSEEIRYLPSALGAFFYEQFPDVNELPALSNEIITFGSLNRLVKVSDISFRAWAEVLLAVPRSRLILKTAELDDAATRERVIGHFTKAGVAADRIIMQGRTSWHKHMQAYNQIDLALDPFPHGGGVTALEGLMMGVPMIALRWPTMAGRVSASIMTALGLTGWIAETREQYVELAIQKASDLQSLATLRQQLRSIFTASVMGDPVAYTRAVEQEYRQLWQRWCARQQVAVTRH